MKLTYNDTLSLMEKFMDESGIRKFCSDFCQGMCCETLGTKCKTGCKDRKLSCGTYVCVSIIHSVFDKETISGYYKIRSMIMPQLRELTQLYDGRCIYTEEVPQDVKEAFTLPAEEFMSNYPTDEEIEAIRKRLEHLTPLILRTKESVRRIYEEVDASLSGGFTSDRHSPRRRKLLRLSSLQ